jgi:UDP-N-acetylmuramate dehydrogenase
MPGFPDRLEPFLPHLRVRTAEPLARHTRFGLGGPADYLIDVDDPAVLPALLAELRTWGLPLITLGGGSNLIVADTGFPGIVLRFTGKDIRFHDGLTTAQTGLLWQNIVDFHSALALSGMEKMTGIPGWFGGALYGNAGAYGQTIMDFVLNVDIFDGQNFRTIPHAECGFAYRTSGFKRHKDWILLAATMRLSPGDGAQIAATAQEILSTRNEKFPPTMKCAGSIFKNLHAAALPEAVLSRVPPQIIRAGKIPSAWFLEQAGSKGMRRGGIEVASYHANLIYNTGTGTAADVCSLIDELKARVLADFGLSLEEEVQYIGFPQRASF